MGNDFNQRLSELGLQQGDEVFVVFRHVRLFPKGRFFETDLPEPAPAAAGDSYTI